MANRDPSLPDISGVFNIDENRIPKKIIDKPAERRQAERGESILIPSAEKKTPKKKEAPEKSAPKTRSPKKQAKAKAFRRRAALVLIALVLVFALVMVVRSTVLEKKKPAVALENPTAQDITSTYAADGSVLSVDPDAETPEFYAVFVDNDYDVHGLQKGQRAQITFGENETVSGVVADIRKEESGADIISRLMNALSGGSFSTASNYTVYVSLDDASYAEENAAVTVTVTTGVAEDVVSVPSDAIHKDDDGQHYVWVFKKLGKKVKRQDVSVGISAGGRTEIRRGLSTEDLIVTDVLGDNVTLYDGVKVRLPEGL